MQETEPRLPYIHFTSLNTHFSNGELTFLQCKQFVFGIVCFVFFTFCTYTKKIFFFILSVNFISLNTAIRTWNSVFFLLFAHTQRKCFFHFKCEFYQPKHTFFKRRFSIFAMFMIYMFQGGKCSLKSENHNTLLLQEDFLFYTIVFTINQLTFMQM